MLQNNPLLLQLKQNLHSQALRLEGIVKGTEKGYGFLEINNSKSYFIPPIFMKKVMHGDKVIAIIHKEQDKEIAEPEKLIKPYLTRFVGRIQIQHGYIYIIPDHPLIKKNIQTKLKLDMYPSFQNGDWVVAEISYHPLTGKDNQFYTNIIKLISTYDDNFIPWWVTLARYNLANTAPETPKNLILQEQDIHRQDMTDLDFITIDNAYTEDIDDAIYLEKTTDERWIVTIAIADPTAWILQNTTLDLIARERAFTYYLPGFNVPMLPYLLSHNLCSLHANECRPALVCRVIVYKDGTISDNICFFVAWIKSKAKLAYNDVSDWLENFGTWKPQNHAIVKQINLLHDFYKIRNSWRRSHALIFKERPEYRFILNNKNSVEDIVIEPRRIAHRMIEETMITANICAARILRNNLGYGLYNIHSGFDPLTVDHAVNILRNNNIRVHAADLLTLEGFCSLRRQLNNFPTSYLDSCLRKFQTFSSMSSIPGPHFGLGLDMYATWTSPIRKYGDMYNHRLLKSLLGIGKVYRLSEEIISSLIEKKRQNRMAERNIEDWLYASFLKNKIGNHNYFSAEIVNVFRSGIRVRLLENGALAFIPATFIHHTRDELIFDQDMGIVKIKGVERYRCGDILDVVIDSVKVEYRSVIVRLI